jgi:hypothetical protein
MRHVFVETNWVVAFAAPAHHKLQVPAAADLLERAATNEILLHLPSVCVSEARHPIHERFQVRNEADRIRQFLLWATDEGHVSPEEEITTRKVLDKMEGFVKRDLGQLENTLASLKNKPGLEIFDVTETMAQRCTELSFQQLRLQAFDQLILAAVLVRSEQLLLAGENDIAFCELDADLQPWDRNRDLKQPLATLYDHAHVWVYGDFLMQAPAKPDGWPGPP